MKLLLIFCMTFFSTVTTYCMKKDKQVLNKPLAAPVLNTSEVAALLTAVPAAPVVSPVPAAVTTSEEVPPADQALKEFMDDVIELPTSHEQPHEELTGLAWYGKKLQQRWEQYSAKIKDDIWGHDKVVLSELENGSFDTHDKIKADHRLDWAIYILINKKKSDRLSNLLNLCENYKIDINHTSKQYIHQFFKEQKEDKIHETKAIYSKKIEEIAQLKKYQKRFGALIKSRSDSDTEYDEKSLHLKMYPELVVKKP